MADWDDDDFDVDIVIPKKTNEYGEEIEEEKEEEIPKVSNPEEKKNAKSKKKAKEDKLNGVKEREDVVDDSILTPKEREERQKTRDLEIAEDLFDGVSTEELLSNNLGFDFRSTEWIKDESKRKEAGDFLTELLMVHRDNRDEGSRDHYMAFLKYLMEKLTLSLPSVEVRKLSTKLSKSADALKTQENEEKKSKQKGAGKKPTINGKKGNARDVSFDDYYGGNDGDGFDDSDDFM